MAKDYVTPVAASIPFDNASNGFAATDVQVAIEEAKSTLTTYDVAASDVTTTTSATFAVIGSTSIVNPIAGTYLAIFSAAMYNTNNNTTGEYAIFVGGAQGHTRGIVSDVQILGLITLSSNNFRIGGSIIGKITVNGAQTVDVRFRRTSGPGNIGVEQRTLTLIRIAA